MTTTSETVAIEAGQDCEECGNPVETQEQKPVVFNCGECDTDHIWHGDCLPEELRRRLEHVA